MKKTYKIEVDCANCANKMEESIKKISGIKDSTVNFMTQKLIVDFEDSADTSAIIQEIERKCRKIESDFVVYR